MNEDSPYRPISSPGLVVVSGLVIIGIMTAGVIIALTPEPRSWVTECGQSPTGRTSCVDLQREAVYVWRGEASCIPRQRSIC